MPILLVHGWGLNAALWREVVPLLVPHEALCLDLGFVRGGPKGWGELPADAICVGHSFGLLWLLKHGPRPMRALISVAGVDCFSACLPLDPLAAMKAGLDRNPAAQMHAFWRACGLDADFSLPEFLDVATLKAGLDWLATWDERDRRRTLDVPILALATRDDRIVPEAATRAIWGDESSRLRWRETGGHALPLTAPVWCAEQIKGFADDL
jgi:pimeloyl-[acyl-carrier protein] methyl ester esterase